MLSYMVSYEYTAAAQHECTVAACSVGSEVILHCRVPWWMMIITGAGKTDTSDLIYFKPRGPQLCLFVLKLRFLRNDKMYLHKTISGTVCTFLHSTSTAQLVMRRPESRPPTTRVNCELSQIRREGS